MCSISNEKIIIIDVQTTGLSEIDCICGVCCLILDVNGKVEEVYNEFCRPAVPMSYQAMADHHIVPEMVENSEVFKDTKIFKRLKDLNHPNNIMVAENIPMHLKILSKEGYHTQCRFIDTLRVLRSKYFLEGGHEIRFKRYQWEFYKNEQFLIQTLDKYNEHPAFWKVIILKEVLARIHIEHSYASMVELCSKPIVLEYIPVGLHKGKRFNDVTLNRSDRNYFKNRLKLCEIGNDMRLMKRYIPVFGIMSSISSDLIRSELDDDIRATLLHYCVYRLAFGPYTGMSFEEVEQIDPEYLDNLVNESNGSDKTTDFFYELQQYVAEHIDLREVEEGKI